MKHALTTISQYTMFTIAYTAFLIFAWETDVLPTMFDATTRLF